MWRFPRNLTSRQTNFFTLNYIINYTLLHWRIISFPIWFQLWCGVALCPLQIHIWQHQCSGCIQRKWCLGCCRDPHARGFPMGSIFSGQASSKWWDAKEVCTGAFQALEGSRGTISWVGSCTRSIHLRNHVSFYNILRIVHWLLEAGCDCVFGWKEPRFMNNIFSQLLSFAET